MTSNSTRSLRKTLLRLESAVGLNLLIVAAVCAPVTALAQTEGDYLFNITMLRAAPGHFVDLVSALEESFELDEEAGDRAPFWIRHTQGDEWDFMLIYPLGDFASYYNPERIRQRDSVWDTMSVGFYESLQAYAAAAGRHSSEEQDAAARAAGFEGVGEIGPYLRTLLSYHHDTLGVRVR